MNFKCFLVIAICITITNGYKILFLAPFVWKSHFLFMSEFVKTLVDRQHEVTYLTSNSLKHLNLPNYTEVLIEPPFDMESIGSQEKWLEMAGSSTFMRINSFNFLSKSWTTHAFSNLNVQKLIHSTGLHFDLIINEEWWADSFLMFAHKFKAPIITICPVGIPDFIDRQQGLFTPLSIVPHWALPFSDNMSFYERWFNAILSTYDWAVREFSYLPTAEEHTRKYFAHLAPLPSLNDILRNVSMVLVNTHRALSPPRPSMPNVVNIGGAHIKPSKLLPEDIQKFIDEAKHGVIYFSIGSILQSSRLPEEKLQAFLETFRKLKQRVLWKFEKESLINVPSNVLIRNWFPQNDILSHSNVILYITHGGLFGTSESLYHGVPLLFIPFSLYQFMNANRIKTEGYGQVLLFNDITKESFSKAVNEILSDMSYLSKAKETSAIFKDNLVHPMDEAMFWIEHVCKFKGAKHLKSHAVNMTWFSYLLFDVLFINAIILFTVIAVVYVLVKSLCSKQKNRQESGKKQK
ncbi:UDP-glucuronosyltransferase 2B20-like [Contarinia nasturtii]|uniref:UDP-glucuronosyltransferase 2B20-like n=1 Tax=Contarinia nasturtii TaxID=265458 RepID=UPI0012D481B8|nr:UDP-glucuronosyltransferase 2B20-like [Contarinia nasturtii]